MGQSRIRITLPVDKCYLYLILKLHVIDLFLSFQLFKEVLEKSLKPAAFFTADIIGQ